MPGKPDQRNSVVILSGNPAWIKVNYLLEGIGNLRLLSCALHLQKQIVGVGILFRASMICFT